MRAQQERVRASECHHGEKCGTIAPLQSARDPCESASVDLEERCSEKRPETGLDQHEKAEKPTDSFINVPRTGWLKLEHIEEEHPLPPDSPGGILPFSANCASGAGMPAGRAPSPDKVGEILEQTRKGTDGTEILFASMGAGAEVSPPDDDVPEHNEGETNTSEGALEENRDKGASFGETGTPERQSRPSSEGKSTPTGLKLLQGKVKPSRKNPTRSSRPLFLLEPGQLSARQIEKGISVDDLGNFSMKSFRGRVASMEDSSSPHDDNAHREYIPPKSRTQFSASHSDEAMHNQIGDTIPRTSSRHQSAWPRKRPSSAGSRQWTLRRSPRKKLRWDDTEQMKSPFGSHTKGDGALEDPPTEKIHYRPKAIPTDDTGLAAMPFPDHLALSRTEVAAKSAATRHPQCVNEDNFSPRIKFHGHDNASSPSGKPKQARPDLGGIAPAARSASARNTATEKRGSKVETQKVRNVCTDNSFETEPPLPKDAVLDSKSHAGKDDSTPWVKLSHIGHISDYHGFQRRHDTFFPLKYSKTVAGTRSSIEATLAQARAENVETDDQDVQDELQELENIYTSLYPQKQNEEQEKNVVAGSRDSGHQSWDCQQQSSSQPKALDEFESRPIVFSCSVNKQLQACSIHNCEICGRIVMGNRDGEENLVGVAATFKLVETEDSLEFWKDGCCETKKRRSRTSELLAYRQISAMMLREMRNTLQFIETYNLGLDGKAKSTAIQNQAKCQTASYSFQTEHDAENRVEQSSALEGLKAEKAVLTTDSMYSCDSVERVARDCGIKLGFGRRSRKRGFGKASNEAVVRGNRSRSTRGTRSITSTASKEIIGHVDLERGSKHDQCTDQSSQLSGLPQLGRTGKPDFRQWVKLSHIGLLSDYEGVCRQHKSYFPLPTHGTIDSLKNTIVQVANGVAFDDADDEDIHAEHRSYMRIVRGYSGKADQERIEKNEHEEQRLLKVREFEYWNKGKKISPEESELLRLETRPIRFVSRGGATTSGRRKCKFGVNCPLCRFDGDANGLIHPTENGARSIRNPGFKKKDFVDMVDPEEATNLDSRRSRTAELCKQRKLSVLQLKEMFNTMNFIQRYNAGWIDTPGKKRRKA